MAQLTPQAMRESGNFRGYRPEALISMLESNHFSRAPHGGNSPHIKFTHDTRADLQCVIPHGRGEVPPAYAKLACEACEAVSPTMPEERSFKPSEKPCATIHAGTCQRGRDFTPEERKLNKLMMKHVYVFRDKRDFCGTLDKLGVDYSARLREDGQTEIMVHYPLAKKANGEMFGHNLAEPITFTAYSNGDMPPASQNRMRGLVRLALHEIRHGEADTLRQANRLTQPGPFLG